MALEGSTSGVYPDPANAPVQFSSSQTPYFNLSNTPIFNRVVSARMYHNGFWVLKDNYAVTQVGLIWVDVTYV